jgi:hypothetical protein
MFRSFLQIFNAYYHEEILYIYYYLYINIIIYNFLISKIEVVFSLKIYYNDKIELYYLRGCFLVC